MAEERLAATLANYSVDFAGFGEPFVREGFTKASDLSDKGRNESDDPIWSDVLDWMGQAATWNADLILAPLSCGGHIDHRITRRAILEVASKLPITVGFYEDLPYSSRLHDTEIEKLVPKLPAYLLEQKVITSGYNEKMGLLQCYRSQLGDEELDDVKQYWDRRGGERLWLPKGFL
jgi:LmbE family N-acetylglucosaminyl deacetylase